MVGHHPLEVTILVRIQASQLWAEKNKFGGVNRTVAFEAINERAIRSPAAKKEKRFLTPFFP